MTSRKKKYIFYCILVYIFIWSVGLKKFVYQKTFGTPTKQELKISENEVYIDLPPNNFREATLGKYKIKFKLLKQYYATGRVIYIDRYTNPLGRFYRASGPGKFATQAYDTIAPQDITFVVGPFAHFPKIKGSHEYRAGGLDYDDEHTYNIYQKYHHLYDTHLTNIHTIAASKNIQKGLDILKNGDLVLLEGYLIYWETQLEDGYVMDFKSAIYPGEKHTKDLYGGLPGAGKCKQLLLTKIIFDGYIFE